MTHGVVADVDEHLHVGAVGLAEQRRPPAGHGLDRVRPARPAADGPTRRRAEPNRPPVISIVGRVIAQERVGGAGGRDRRAQLRLGVARRSGRAGRRSGRRRSTRSSTVEAHSPPPTIPMIVGYGRPSAVMSGSVSASLRRASSASSARLRHEQLVERGDALPAQRRVRRAAGHGQPEGDRAGVGDDDVEVRTAR